MDTSFLPVCHLCGTLEKKKKKKKKNKNASQSDISPSNNTSSTRST